MCSCIGEQFQLKNYQLLRNNTLLELQIKLGRKKIIMKFMFVNISSAK